MGNSPWTKNQKINVLSIIINNIFSLEIVANLALLAFLKCGVLAFWRVSFCLIRPPPIHSAQKGRLDFNLNAHNSGF